MTLQQDILLPDPNSLQQVLIYRLCNLRLPYITLH